jgi:hypothetical protein
MKKKKVLIFFSAIFLAICLSVSVVMACCMVDCCCMPKKGEIVVSWACACDGGDPIGQVCTYQ